jgi:sortase (surface protein transpeptidase)
VAVDETDAERDAAPPVLAMPRSAPLRLQVEAIDVDSNLVSLSVQSDGTLEVPAGGFPAGWFTGGPTPGERGPAVIVGHVDWGGHPGVFIDLGRLTVGDDIVVTRADGSTARFRVTSTAQITKQAFPTRLVYGDLDHAGLRLITCGGSFDDRTRSYVDNLIVFATLVATD